MDRDYESISSPGAFWALVYFNLITFIGEKSLKRNEYKSFTSLKRLMKHDAPKLIYKKSIKIFHRLQVNTKEKLLSLSMISMFFSKNYDWEMDGQYDMSWCIIPKLCLLPILWIHGRLHYGLIRLHCTECLDILIFHHDKFWITGKYNGSS